MESGIWLARRTILLVSPGDGEERSLRSIFRDSSWELRRAAACDEACEELRRHPVPVVICDGNPGGCTWRELLEQVMRMPRPPAFIVTSRAADERLWDEVLNAGGYDVLAAPFDEGEVRRVADLAWRSRAGCRRAGCES